MIGVVGTHETDGATELELDIWVVIGQACPLHNDFREGEAKALIPLTAIWFGVLPLVACLFGVQVA